MVKNVVRPMRNGGKVNYPARYESTRDTIGFNQTRGNGEVHGVQYIQRVALCTVVPVGHLIAGVEPTLQPYATV